MIVCTAPTGSIGHQVLEHILGASEPVRVIARDHRPSHLRHASASTSCRTPLKEEASSERRNEERHGVCDVLLDAKARCQMVSCKDI